MEIRRLSVCVAIYLLVVIFRCSGANHVMSRRNINEDYDFPADGTSDPGEQNDADGGDDQADEGPEVNGVILTQPSTYNITVGRSLRLECKVSPENSGLVVEWSRDNVKYFIGSYKTTAQERYSIVPKSNDLLIRDVNHNDSGVYNCTILQGRPTTIVHTVVVFESPRIISLTATKNGHVVENDDLTLTCEVSGIPPPQIIWTKLGANESNERLTEKDGEFSVNSLYIHGVQRQHAGKYYCYAFNPSGTNQAEVTVSVKPKLQVHIHKTVVNSAINVPAILQCKVHEEIAPMIRWYKDGKLISDSPIFKIETEGTSSNLTVTPATSEDFGNYTCQAENSIEKHSKSVTLIENPVVEDLDADGPKLTWTVHSHLPLEQIVIDLRNEQGNYQSVEVPVPERMQRRYSLTHVLDERQLTPGRYWAYVKVKNSHDWSPHSDETPLEIVDRPEPIQHASVFRGSGNSMQPISAVLMSTILMYLLVRML